MSQIFTRLTHDPDRLMRGAILLSLALHCACMMMLAEFHKLFPSDALSITPISVTFISQDSAPQQEPETVAPPELEAVPFLPARKPLVPQKKIEQTAKHATTTPETTTLPVANSEPSTDAPNPGVPATPYEQINPEIPEELKKQEFKSYVRVKVEIEADGTASPFLKTSSGNQQIDERVLTALKKWRWHPALLEGRAVNSVRYFKFEFEVKG